MASGSSLKGRGSLQIRHVAHNTALYYSQSPTRVLAYLTQVARRYLHIR